MYMERLKIGKSLGNSVPRRRKQTRKLVKSPQEAVAKAKWACKYPLIISLWDGCGQAGRVYGGEMVFFFFHLPPSTQPL